MFLILTILFTITCQIFDQGSNNFEGKLTYRRYANSSSYALEEYYFKEQKMRKDETIYYSDTTIHNTDIFLFDTNPNIVFKKRDEVFFPIPFKRSIKPDVIDTIDKRKIEILNYSCSEILMMGTTYWGNDLPIQFSHQIWVAKDLKFRIPKEWQNPPYIITEFDHRIALKMIELGETPHGKRTGFTREIVSLEIMPIENYIFDII